MLVIQPVAMHSNVYRGKETVKMSHIRDGHTHTLIHILSIYNIILINYRKYAVNLTLRGWAS